MVNSAAVQNPLTGGRLWAAAVFTISLTFAGFFAANVLTPLWLQSFMGYTATEAGETTAWSGIAAFCVAPMVAALSMKKDPRILTFCGVLWIGLVTGYRATATTDMTYWNIAHPIMLMGLGMPFFFIPSTATALSSVDVKETNSAAGLMNFMRTLAGAVATSVVTTYWDDEATRHRADLVGYIDPGQTTYNQLLDQGMNADQARLMLEQLLTGQSVMLATNKIMLIVSAMLIFSAFVIWLVPKPMRKIDPGQGH